MKTTIEISGDLITRANALATRRNTTLSALIEQGLRHVLNDEQPPTKFKLRDGTVDGQGLRKEFRGKDWATIRDSAY